jgi:Inorganic pyrophosphatase
MQNLLYVLPLFGVMGLLYVVWKSAWVAKQDAGTDKMKKIAGHIAEGAMAFLKAEYKVLAIFVVCVAVLLAVTATAKHLHLWWVCHLCSEHSVLPWRDLSECVWQQRPT